MAEYEDKLLDHDYDGIRELDNDLPRWWVWLFIGTIIWSFFYMLYFDVLGIGYSSTDAYRKEMNPEYVRESNLRDTYFGVLPKYRPVYDNERYGSSSKKTAPVRFVALSRDSDTTTYVALMDEAALSTGADVFVQNCASCHGNLGEGKIGPNLTDQYWLHGAGISDVVKSVKYGFPTKGMVSWIGTLDEESILQVSSHVTTLIGSDPPNQKAPEGDLVTE